MSQVYPPSSNPDDVVQAKVPFTACLERFALDLCSTAVDGKILKSLWSVIPDKMKAPRVLMPRWTYSSLLAREYKKWEMIAVIVAKKSSKSTNGRARARLAAERTYSYTELASFAALLSLLQLPIASVLVQS